MNQKCRGPGGRGYIGDILRDTGKTRLKRDGDDDPLHGSSGERRPGDKRPAGGHRMAYRNTTSITIRQNRPSVRTGTNHKTPPSSGTISRLLRGD